MLNKSYNELKIEAILPFHPVIYQYTITILKSREIFSILKVTSYRDK